MVLDDYDDLFSTAIAKSAIDLGIVRCEFAGARCVMTRF